MAVATLRFVKHFAALVTGVDQHCRQHPEPTQRRRRLRQRPGTFRPDPRLRHGLANQGRTERLTDGLGVGGSWVVGEKQITGMDALKTSDHGLVPCGDAGWTGAVNFVI